MGKKSSNAPAPDPRLVDAQVRSMGVEEDAIGRMLGNADRAMALQERMQPLQEQQLQFGLDAAKQGYKDLQADRVNAQADREYSLGRRTALSGVQDQLISDATGFNSAERQHQLAGEAISGVHTAFSGARAMAARGLERSGVNPNSGKFGGMVKELATQEALAAAGAGTQAGRQARTEGYALTDRAANALAGYPAMSMAATGAGAQYAGAGAQMAGSGINLVNAGVGGMQAGYGNLNTMYGGAANAAANWGSNATGMYGQQAAYKNQQDKIAMENGASGMGLLGTLAGVGAKLYLGSARAYKQAIVRIGTHPAGFGIYEFEYRESHRAKWGAGRHVGVMADEVAGVIPGAVLIDADGDTVVNYAML
jgi:hypothetical protein